LALTLTPVCRSEIDPVTVFWITVFESMFTVTWLCCVVVTVMLLLLIALIVPIVSWRPVPPPGKMPLGLVVSLPLPGVA
jgi:hypothetical protein